MEDVFMTQQELESAVAEATGESLRTIRRRGFSIVDPSEGDFDPEPNILPFQVVDWDQADRQRRAA
jgi:hypothetical protein